MMANVEENGVSSLNILKRKKEDCAEEQLEAEIKRVALHDDAECPTASSVDSIELDGRDTGRYSNGESLENFSEELRDSRSRQTHLRMLCLVKQASMVVGHKGETISRIKALTSTRINVSDNVRGVPERVVYVRGSCENVAKAFGMIVRSISDKSENESLEDIPTTINLLISHHLMGCVIGKHGSRLKEIEELSAARLSAMPQQLMMSNDRILTIEGVADAIHIATFYIGQTIMNCKDVFKSKKAIFYQPSPVYSVLLNGVGPMAYSHQQHHQYHPADKYRNGKRLPRSSVMFMMPAAAQTVQQRSPVMYTAANAANAHAFTPNFMIPNVRIIDGPVATPVAQTMAIVQQEIYIDENFVGNIIGKDGKHINSIKESTGCSIYIDDPIGGALERKLTVRGTSMGSQAAIMLISNKIEIDKVNKERKK
ncbi:related to PAB1-binding protein 2 [Zygosaccharomyces bailii ISA1307]|nr:related to PAB1-binding protein 2 [Zygosaccharomyces bailii ISA1307]